MCIRDSPRPPMNQCQRYPKCRGQPCRNACNPLRGKFKHVERNHQDMMQKDLREQEIDLMEIMGPYDM
eukprot:3844049-Ditylum_brightwellii.AAC.1